MLINANFYFEPRARLYKVTETEFVEPKGEYSGLVGVGNNTLRSISLSQEELLEKIGKTYLSGDDVFKEDKGYAMTDIICEGDKLTLIYEKREGNVVDRVAVIYWGGLEVVEANEVLETPDGHYKMRRVHRNEGERILKRMGDKHSRVERTRNRFEMSEILIGEEMDEEGNLKGVGLVSAPSQYWPTRYYKQHRK